MDSKQNKYMSRGRNHETQASFIHHPALLDVQDAMNVEQRLAEDISNRACKRCLQRALSINDGMARAILTHVQANNQLWCFLIPPRIATPEVVTPPACACTSVHLSSENSSFGC